MLTIEHRAAAAPDPLRLRLVIDGEADAHLAIVDGDTEVAGLGDDSDLDRRLLETLRRAAAPSVAPNSAPSSTCATSVSATRSHDSPPPVPSFAKAIDGPFPFPLLKNRRERNGTPNHAAR